MSLARCPQLKSSFAPMLKAMLTQIDIISNDVWTALIPRLFTLKQYGFLACDFPSTSGGPRKFPAGLQIRCWEARDPERYFTLEQREVVLERQKEREAARSEVLAILKTMDDVEILELLKTDKADKDDKAVKERVKKEKKPRSISLQVSDIAFLRPRRCD